MRLEFSYEYANLLIILLGLLFIVYMLSRKMAKKRVITFGNFEVLEKVVERKIFAPEILPMALRILAIILIIISISNPRLTYTLYSSDVEYVIAIDTSSSMLTPDFYPNRLEVAKDVVWRSLEKLKHTKVGIVTFSGKAYIKSELTNEIPKLRDIVLKIQVEPPAGTAIGDALISSAALLTNGESGKNKTIILITDGRNNLGVSLEEAIKPLLREKIKVFSIGIGGNQTTNVTLPEELKEVNATVAEFPVLDEESLKWLSNVTGGMYFRVTNITEFEDALEKSIEKREITINPTTYLLILASLILLLEWSLEMTKFRVIP